MATLLNSQKKMLISNLRTAETIWARTKGLLGTQSLSESEGLWIKRCNSVHTFFMNYAIDCVFVDRTLLVKGLVAELKPGRMHFPIWGASSVFELPEGSIQKHQIRVGDQLYVVT